MAKYLLLKHYRGAPESVNCVPMDQWAPEEVDAHMQYMHDFALDSRELESSSTDRRWHPRAPGSAMTAKDGHR